MLPPLSVRLPATKGAAGDTLCLGRLDPLADGLCYDVPLCITVSLSTGSPDLSVCNDSLSRSVPVHGSRTSGSARRATTGCAARGPIDGSRHSAGHSSCRRARSRSRHQASCRPGRPARCGPNSLTGRAPCRSAAALARGQAQQSESENKETNHPQLLRLLLPMNASPAKGCSPDAIQPRHGPARFTVPGSPRWFNEPSPAGGLVAPAQEGAGHGSGGPGPAAFPDRSGRLHR